MSIFATTNEAPKIDRPKTDETVAYLLGLMAANKAKGATVAADYLWDAIRRLMAASVEPPDLNPG